jgi:hypothetical protein
MKCDGGGGVGWKVGSGSGGSEGAELEGENKRGGRGLNLTVNTFISF